MNPSPVAIERAVDLLGCLAHPDRLAVVHHLHHQGPATVSALCEVFGVEQSAMSHHLRKLREARLVGGLRQGRTVLYGIDDAHVAAIVDDTLAHVGEAL